MDLRFWQRLTALVENGHRITALIVSLPPAETYAGTYPSAKNHHRSEWHLSSGMHLLANYSSPSYKSKPTPEITAPIIGAFSFQSGEPFSAAMQDCVVIQLR